MGYNDILRAAKGTSLAIYWGNTRVLSEHLLADLAAELITVIADGGGGTVICTSAAHALHVGSRIIIAGTTNYNGFQTVVSKTTNTFTITDTWVPGVETGSWLYNAAGEAGVYWLEHFPVNTDDFRLIGWVGTNWAFLANVELEPMTGRVTLPATYPVFDDVYAWYGYYDNIEFDLLVKDFLVPLPDDTPEIDIWKQPRWTKGNVYPPTLTFKLILLVESMRNLFTESIFHDYNFLVLDTGTPETYGIRAYEGSFTSNEQGSLYKGLTYLLPFTQKISQFGLVDLELSGAFSSAAGTIGVAPTSIGTVGLHGLTTGDWVTIDASTVEDYIGTWQITVINTSTFQIDRAFSATATGTWFRPQGIDWSFWQR